MLQVQRTEQWTTVSGALNTPFIHSGFCPRPLEPDSPGVSLALAYPSCVLLNKLFNLSGPQFLIYKIS